MRPHTTIPVASVHTISTHALLRHIQVLGCIGYILPRSPSHSCIHEKGKEPVEQESIGNYTVKNMKLIFRNVLLVIIFEPYMTAVCQMEYAEEGQTGVANASKLLAPLSENDGQQQHNISGNSESQVSNINSEKSENSKQKTIPNTDCMPMQIYSTDAELTGPGLSYSTTYNITGHLYGGPVVKRQYWPIDNVTFENSSYVTKTIHGIAERYWLTSDGTFYYVQPESSLFIQQNIETPATLEFISENKEPYPNPRPLILSHTRCKSTNAREGHMFAVQNYLGKPSDIPDEQMIKKPIWSTWARYKTDINEKKILEFVDQIVNNGFENSQIEIDDMWETCYGSLTFDANKFPNMKRLSETLKQKGFRVTLWVHPFINVNCNPYYQEAMTNGYFVKNTEGNTTTTWWNGEAGIIDFTSPKAVQWWTDRIRKVMQDNGIDSLKLDAGETNLLPQIPVLTGNISLQPNIYTQKYVETAVQFGNMIEVRVGFRTQHFPIFVRMHHKESTWSFDSGLPTLITTLLQMNLAGYTFVLPDMVGGNGYEGTGAPSKELFIRWLQANVFMPAIQYSFVPWQYDNETIEICKKYTELHEKYSGEIIAAMRNTTIYGTPVNPPIWWIDPEDEVAQIIDDEFLLGEKLLAAPVLEEGQISRDIYLPKGVWQDKLRGGTIQGPVWLRNYSVALGELAYFELGIGERGAAVPHTIEIMCFIFSLFATYIRIPFI